MSCQDAPPQLPPYKAILSRGDGSSSGRTPLYQISLPSGWEEIQEKQSISDTTVPIFKCFYEEDGCRIQLTIHNFPLQVGAFKIPPEAQVERWKNQFAQLSFSHASPQSFAGFIGLQLYAEGVIAQEETAVLAWAMKIAPENERSLSFFSEKYPAEMGCDVTIKATGPKKIIEEHAQEIASIARSFELLPAFPLL